MKENQNIPKILLIDDEQDILFIASVTLKKALNCQVVTINDSSKVMPFLETEDVAMIILDLFMPVISGQELLKQLNYKHPHIPVIVMTASNSIESAVECMSIGAFDYLVKPVEKNRLATSVIRAMETMRLREEVSSLRQHLLTGELQHEAAFAPIVTRSKKMRAIFHYLESVSACSDQPVLISGETGTGKELIARAIHDLSGRKGQFIAVNVAGLDDLMFSDTLFGHRKGAYTGADQAREGLVAQAADGTLFLDEIGDLNAASQVKLLRLLQEREYYPLGSDVAKRSSVRVVAASNRDLLKMIGTGEFRNDLYYRLCAHNCCIPPLRERKEDLPLLLDYFLKSAAVLQHKKVTTYPDALVSLLTSYPFPGNVRELQAMVHDAVARHGSGPLSMEIFRERIPTEQITVSPEPVGLSQELSGEVQMVFSHFPTMKEVEQQIVQMALTAAHGNQGIAASLLGMTRQALNNRLIRERNQQT